MHHIHHTVRRPTRTALVFLTTALSLAACDYPPPENHAFRKDNPYQKDWAYERDRDDESRPARRAKAYDLVTKNGTYYGTAELYSNGRGKLLDNDGHVIGRIILDE